MRPVFSLCHVVGGIMLLYAAGVLLTPTSGAMRYLNTYTFFTPHLVAFIFAACGLAIGILKPNPALFSLLTTPILLYAIASVFIFLDTPTISLTPVAAHAGLWLTIMAALYEKARQWTF